MIVADVDIRGFQEWTKESTKELTSDEREKAIRMLGFKFIEIVVPKTPVDTGRARSGWVMPGKVSAEGEANEYGRGTSAYGMEFINAVPYIVYLELGSSRQATSGFVRHTLREMRGDLIGETKKDTFRALSRANDRARRTVGLRQGGTFRSADTLRGRGLI